MKRACRAALRLSPPMQTKLDNCARCVRQRSASERLRTRSSVDVVIADDLGSVALASLLGHARQVADLHNAARHHETESALRQARTRQLADIGIALSTERDPVRLLETILSEARRLADCDAGSLYLVEESGTDRMLQFKLAQNDSAVVPFKEARLPLTSESLCGYVALTGEELNIADAYEIGTAQPYVFNRSFDDKVGYRTRSLLVLPMSDHKGRVIGVLQFINRRGNTVRGSRRGAV